MKVMLLAAGRGQRMMPLTANQPKPLLKVAGKPLLQHHIEKLRDAGLTELVINHCYLGEQIEAYFGDGQDFGVSIEYSPETIALETAGGLKNAIDKLGKRAFAVVNGDVWSDYPFEKLTNSPHIEALETNKSLAHLILVNNPPQNLSGDFGLKNSQILNNADKKFTYSGIGLYSPSLIETCETGVPTPLAPLLRAAADKNLITGELYPGKWTDVGTPERLNELNSSLQ
ncbi:nucleotidyltransferase family protein [Aliikangiella marina]|uniref:Nucleotidyltransferase family protein n=1 Tax=Aliikangiella marina TaxID=1712262 RepID=A0A545TCD4_9GAMM|nr:nucleotidyltransferase family protein [Aliikangiella marina]TQV74851.1 nucleotidyltransferase family protein [Aliikangiella marina]